MKINGKILRIALRIADITQETAAKRLGISRQTLSTYLRSEELSHQFVQNVKSELNIDLHSVKENTQSGEIKPYKTDIDYQKEDGNNKVAEPGTDYVKTAISEAERLGYYVTIYKTAKSMPLENFLTWCAENNHYFK